MQMLKVKAKYSKATEFIWVQEEPENMGAWPYICRKFRKSELQLDVISRSEGSSTATGFAKQHMPSSNSCIATAFEAPAGKAVKQNIKKTTENMAGMAAD